MSKPDLTKMNPIEERLNAYSHALGVLLSILGTICLLQHTTDSSEETFSITIYCISLLVLFSASTLYHAATDIEKKKNLRVLDHISIYYLIAGTYTPVCLLVLSHAKGWLLLYLVWGIAIIGTLLKLFFTAKFEALSLILYVVMGWIIVIDISSLIESISSKGLFYLSLGGGFYTLGILFYAIKKIPYNHLIWHFFVLGGAISHWLMVRGLL